MHCVLVMLKYVKVQRNVVKLYGWQYGLHSSFCSIFISTIIFKWLAGFRKNVALLFRTSADQIGILNTFFFPACRSCSLKATLKRPVLACMVCSLLGWMWMVLGTLVGIWIIQFSLENRFISFSKHFEICGRILFVVYDVGLFV